MKKIFIYLLLILVSLVSANAVLNDSIAYYSFDNATISGVNIEDISGSGNNATRTTTTPSYTTNGFFNEAQEFAPTAAKYIDFGSALIPATGDWTFSAWINLTNASSSGAIFLSQYNPSGGGRFLCRYIPSSNVVACDSNGVFSTGSVGVTINNNWRFILIERNNGRFQMWEDGSLISNVSASGSIYTGEPTQINARLGSWTSQMIIDEANLYNRSLTSSEKTSLYNAGVGFNPYATGGGNATTPDVNSNLTSYYNTSSFNVSLTANQTINISYFLNGNDSNLESGLTLYYQAEDNFTSKTGSHDGTNNGATFSTGLNGYGRAFDFDGTSYVSTANFGVVNDVTQCAWIQPTALSGAQGILGKVYGSTSGSRSGTVRAQGSDLTYYLRNTTGGGFEISWSAGLSNDVWTHFCAVTSGNDMLLYVNGSLVANDTFTGTLSTGSSNFEIGNKDSGSGTPDRFLGLIDEVKVFNSSLNSSQISSLASKSPYTVIASNTNSSSLEFLSLSEGSYNVTWVGADYVGVSYNAESFTVDLTPPTISNNINATYYSYTIDGFNSSCSDTSLQSCNISLNSQNVLLNVSTFTFTTSGNITYNITAIDTAGNTISESGVTFVTPVQHIRFNDTTTSSYVQNYSVVIDGDVYSITGEYFNIPLYDLGIGTHQLDFTKAGYSNESFNITFNATSDYNISYDVDRVTLTIKVYDATDYSQLIFNLTILNDTTSDAFTNQLNFSQEFVDIPIGDIQLLISSQGYSDVLYYQTLNQYSSIDIEAYMFPENVSDVVTFTVQDKATSASLDNVLIELQALINGTYTTLNQKYSSSSGQAFFYVDITQSYKVIFTRSGYVTATAFTIPGTTSYTVKLESSSTSYSYIDGISYNIIPSNTLVVENQSYSFGAFISGTGLTQTYFKLYWGNGTTIYSSSSTNPTGTTFGYSYLLPLNPNSSNIYINLTYIKDGVTQQIIKTYDVTVYNNASFMDTLIAYGDDTSDDAMILKWFIIMVVGTILTVMGATLGIQSVNLLLIPFVAFLTLVGWLSWAYAAVIITIILILFVGGRK